MKDHFTRVAESFYAVSRSSPVYRSCQGSTEALQKNLPLALWGLYIILPRYKINQHSCRASKMLFADCLQIDVRDSVYVIWEQNNGIGDSFPATVQRSALNICVPDLFLFSDPALFLSVENTLTVSWMIIVRQSPGFSSGPSWLTPLWNAYKTAAVTR